MYGETFYGRRTAQHQLQLGQIKSEMRSFKSNENIHKKESGSYYVIILPVWWKLSHHTTCRKCMSFKQHVCPSVFP